MHTQVQLWNLILLQLFFYHRFTIQRNAISECVCMCAWSTASVPPTGGWMSCRNTIRCGGRCVPNTGCSQSKLHKLWKFFFFFAASISREIIWTNTYVGNSMPNYPVDLTNGKSLCEWNLLYLLPVMAQRKIWKGQVTKLRTNLLNDCRFGFLVEFPFLMTLFEDWPRSRCKGLKPRPFLPVQFKFGAPCSDWPKIWDLVLRHHHQQAQ